MKKEKRLFLSACLATGLAVSALTGCHNIVDTAKKTNIVEDLTHDKTEARLSTRAAIAIAEGRQAEALVHYERLYASRGGHDKITAVNYAQLLRNAGRTDKALRVLDAYVDTGREKTQPRTRQRARYNTAATDPMVLNEYAACLIDKGDFAQAQDLLARVVNNENTLAFHADAYNLLGVAHDGQRAHQQATEMFHRALEGWKGNPSSVLNNLGLSLASQGQLDTALMHLRQALVLSPDKAEIARNIQIVSDLRDSIIPKAPVKLDKTGK